MIFVHSQVVCEIYFLWYWICLTFNYLSVLGKLEGKWCVFILLWSLLVMVSTNVVHVVVNGIASLFRFQLYLFGWAETQLSISDLGIDICSLSS